jgi:hypothetical protein
MNLYDFSELKIFVQRQYGVDPDRVSSRFNPIIERLTRAQLDKNVIIGDKGIFFVDKEGNKHKGFLYIERGYNRQTAIQRRWQTIVPKFHTCNCVTIQEQKAKKNFDGHYIFSTEVIKMIDLDDVEKELSICMNCVRSSDALRAGMTTSEYREEVILDEDANPNFRPSEMPKAIPTNFWGYTSDWDEASKNYRMKMKFTCEDCGLVLNQSFAFGYFLETHHLNGNKKDNSDSNLRCLCVLCHANVDEIHRQNYSKGFSGQKLRDFIRQFEDKLRVVGNRYLDSYIPRRR